MVSDLVVLEWRHQHRPTRDFADIGRRGADQHAVDPALPSGKRIVRAELLGEGETTKALVPTGRYRVALVDYLERRGDGYAMLAKGTPVEASDPVDVDVLSAYIKKYSPLNTLPPDRLQKQTK